VERARTSAQVRRWCMANFSVEDQERFRDRYRISGSEALIAAEMEVLGSDYQANGYTTMDQADELGALLGLEPASRLLDVGSGCGWPGLYLAKKHGCAVVSVDPVDEGMHASVQRGRRDRCRSHAGVVGQGGALPFAPRVFDAVVHGDVTC